MNVTVVIPALNAVATLPAQLEALDEQVGAPVFRVIVVDNGSTDSTGACAAGFPARHFDIEVVHEPVRGINSARNAGAAAALDGAVLLCDADDLVHPGWVAAMTSALVAGGWVGGRLDYLRLNSPRTRLVWGAPDLSSYAETDPFVDTTYGCNCGFWRSMWEELLGFDASISGTGGDETEFFMRAWGAGYRRVDAADAIVSYRLRAGVRTMLRQRYRQGRNQVVLGTLAGGRLLPGALTAAGTRRALAYRVLAVPKYVWRASARYAWSASVALHLGRLRGFRRVAHGASANSPRRRGRA